jgi:hypothetical protein
MPTDRHRSGEGRRIAELKTAGLWTERGMCPRCGTWLYRYGNPPLGSHCGERLVNVRTREEEEEKARLDEARRPPARHVFVSYSHVDSKLVTRLVELLRVMGGRVFQDVDSIPPGKRWRIVIEDSLRAASVVLLFWCEHSSRSREVRREWMRGMCTNKDIVPALVDGTPLDARLKQYQYIDLRSLFRGHGNWRWEQLKRAAKKKKGGGGGRRLPDPQKPGFYVPLAESRRTKPLYEKLHKASDTIRDFLER